MAKVYVVSVKPENWSGDDETLELGIFVSLDVAQKVAADWIEHSRPPHSPDQHGNPCCTWETTILPVTLNHIRRYY